MNLLKQHREATSPKLSHRRAAAELGIAPSTLYHQEKLGFDPANLSVNELEARAKLYGCTVSDLIGRALLANAS
jgi:hypothetical protein